MLPWQAACNDLQQLAAPRALPPPRQLHSRYRYTATATTAVRESLLLRMKAYGQAYYFGVPGLGFNQEGSGPALHALCGSVKTSRRPPAINPSCEGRTACLVATRGTCGNGEHISSTVCHASTCNRQVVDITLKRWHFSSVGRCRQKVFTPAVC